MSDRSETVIDEWICARGMDYLGMDAGDLIATLKAARIALVELPEPAPSNDPEIAGEWLGGEVMAFRDGRMEYDFHTIYPKNARTIARALLAGVELAGEMSE